MVIGIFHFCASRSTGVEGRAGTHFRRKPGRWQAAPAVIVDFFNDSRISPQPGGSCRAAGIGQLVGDVKKRTVTLVTLLTSLGEAAKDTGIGSIIGRG